MDGGLVSEAERNNHPSGCSLSMDNNQVMFNTYQSDMDCNNWLTTRHRCMCLDARSFSFDGCEATCTALETVPDGYVLEDLSGTTVSGLGSISCATGYIGEATATCDVNGDFILDGCSSCPTGQTSTDGVTCTSLCTTSADTPGYIRRILSETECRNFYNNNLTDYPGGYRTENQVPYSKGCIIENYYSPEPTKLVYNSNNGLSHTIRDCPDNLGWICVDSPEIPIETGGSSANLVCASGYSGTPTATCSVYSRRSSGTCQNSTDENGCGQLSNTLMGPVGLLQMTLVIYVLLDQIGRYMMK